MCVSEFATGRRPVPGRAGFTVLELLVSIGIIAVLCAIVLPAVERAREAARRTQCANHLRQIGIALHAYHAARDCFPSGWVLDQPVSGASRNGWGWLAMLLPMTDQSALYNHINLDCHLSESSNETVRLASVEWFLCPSDRAPRRVTYYRRGSFASSAPRALAHSAADSGAMFDVAAASYVGAFGIHDPDDRSDVRGEGVFGLNTAIRSSEILDGASHTLLAGERSASRLAGTWTGMHVDEEEGPERVIGFAEHAPNDPLADEAEFSSRHPGGAQFLFGDGAVRLIGDHVDQRVYQSLGTRAGGELVDWPRF